MLSTQQRFERNVCPEPNSRVHGRSKRECKTCEQLRYFMRKHKMATDGANYGGGKKGRLQEGLKTRSPPVDDASRKPKGGHVDDSPTRSEPSKQQPTVGPRTA
jgi:hypothetical protein